jgi:hypothetical protein
VASVDEGQGKPGTARRRGRRALRAAVIVVVAIGAALAALYATLPSAVARFAPYWASHLGVETVDIRISRPGLRQVAIAHVRVGAAGVTVEGREGVLEYAFVHALRGRFDALHFASVSVTVDDRETVGTGTGAGFWVGDLPLAMIPLERAAVERLELSVSRLGFQGTGSLALIPGLLHVRLRGDAPAAALGLDFEAALSGAGEVALRLRESELPPDPGTDAPPALVDVAARRDGAELDVRGRFDLDGLPFELVAALARLPPGVGSVSGVVAGRMPWPVPEAAPWRAFSGRVSAALEWTSSDDALGLEAANVALDFDGGVVAGQAGGILVARDARLPFALESERFEPGPAQPRGDVTGHLGPAAAPWVDWRARGSEDRLRLIGSYRLGDEALALIRDRIGLPGLGTGRGTFETVLPWPPALPELADLDVAGTHDGEWAAPSWAVSPVRVSWTVRDQRMTAALEGALHHGAYRVPFTARLRTGTLTGPRYSVTGGVSTGPLVDVPVTIAYDTSDGALRVAASHRLTVEQPLAAGLLPDWDKPWDLDSGRLEGALRLERTGAGVIHATADIRLANAGARVAGMRFDGAAGAARLLVADGRLEIPMTDVSAVLVSAGVDFNDARARVGWRDGTVRVEAASARAFEGTFETGPFEYGVETGQAAFDVEVTGVDLGRLLALYGDRVTASGTLDGRLPVRIDDRAVRVDAGRIDARPPGGQIRVAEGLVRGIGQPGLDFALRALGDFTYTLLSAEVDYAPDGQAVIAVQLRGRNPRIEGGRPIHYNLTVTENVLELLRSLGFQQRIIRGIERQVTN